MKKTITILLLALTISANSQSSGYIIPADYLSDMKIKRIMEIDLADSLKMYCFDFYNNGLLKQRTNPSNREEFDEDEIDINYKGKYLTFYETYIYDSAGNIELTASSWSGLKENYFMIVKYSLLSNSDTLLIQSYSGNSIKPHLLKQYQSRIKDTVQLDENKYAFISSTSDTLKYKMEYKTPFGDSITYYHSFYTPSDILTKYYVYQDKLLTSAGIITSVKDEPVRDHYRIIFDREGYPYLVIENNTSYEEPKMSKIVVEKF